MNGKNEPSLVSLIMDELKQHGRDLREHSEKADRSSKALQSEIGLIREQQSGFAIEIRSIHGQLSDIKTTLAPLSTQVAVNADNIGELKKDKDTIFSHITQVKDSIRGRSSTSFWDGPNARYVIMGGLVILVGLFGLAGYNISLKDLPL